MLQGTNVEHLALTLATTENPSDSDKGLTKGQTTMYSIWIQVNPTTWVETRSRFIEEQQAHEKARQYLGDMYDVRVFVQFDSEPDMQEII